MRTSADATENVATFLDLPLTNLSSDRRCHDRDQLVSLLNMARNGATVGELVTNLERAGVGRGEAHATIAWLLKYGLLTPVT